jgi:peptidoglycan glycosyltransferase
VFDRTGHALASYQIANPDLVTIDAQFAPVIDRHAGAVTIGAHLQKLGVNESIDTTLDPEVQRAALAALGGFRGSLVAIDPRTNEILAIASNIGAGPLENLAIEHQYEPGSVVKMLTGLDALSGGTDIKSMFPYDCKGDLVIEGRHLGDSVPAGHGPLHSIDEALAVSCNIVFGDLGVRMGAERLRQFMTSAGFDGQANLGLFEAPLGKIIPPVVNKYETALFAIGLQHESVNALHLAMLASMMASRGVLTNPRLLGGRRSILGDVVVAPAPQASRRVAPAEVADVMIAAMKAVVTDPRGTGKRAAIDGLSIAMKTGTTGESGSGVNSLILAFAPAEQPKIAFGMIVEDSGPAEFAGAKIARDFLVAIQPRLR